MCISEVMWKRDVKSHLEEDGQLYTSVHINALMFSVPT